AYLFDVERPVNTRAADIHGWEFAGQYFFGDSGFGALANYTVVDGDVNFDDTADPGVNQFAIFGLSDSANAALMYENFGVSIRLAYNWRDHFLQNANVDGYHNPIYVQAYHQIDLNIAYDLSEHLSVSLEGINLTGEDTRAYARATSQIWSFEDQSARYSLGLRYRL